MDDIVVGDAYRNSTGTYHIEALTRHRMKLKTKGGSYWVRRTSFRSWLREDGGAWVWHTLPSLRRQHAT